jgi:hypothetical protein
VRISAMKIAERYLSSQNRVPDLVELVGNMSQVIYLLVNYYSHGKSP